MLEIESPATQKLQDVGWPAAVNLWPLLRPFTVLAERYNERYYSPQSELFATPVDEEDAKWSRYFHQVLLPHLLMENEVVRNVLRAVRATPSRDPDAAALALSQYFTEITLPGTKPLWASEQPFDF